jgi:hypothetical protein
MHPDCYAGTGGDKVVYKDYSINRRQAEAVIGRAHEVQIAAPKYDIFGYNCTAFARDLVRAAGLKFPGRKVDPTGLTGKKGRAFTPNRLFGALKSQERKGQAYSYADRDSTQLLEGVISQGRVPRGRVLTAYGAPTGGRVGFLREDQEFGLTTMQQSGRVKVANGLSFIWLDLVELADLRIEVPAPEQDETGGAVDGAVEDPDDVFEADDQEDEEGAVNF